MKIAKIKNVSFFDRGLIAAVHVDCDLNCTVVEPINPPAGWVYSHREGSVMYFRAIPVSVEGNGSPYQPVTLVFLPFTSKIGDVIAIFSRCE